MAKYRTELPKTAMNRKLLRGLKRLKALSLQEKVQLQLRAKLLTPEQAAEIQARFTPEELAAKPAPPRPEVAAASPPSNTP